MQTDTHFEADVAFCISANVPENPT